MTSRSTDGSQGIDRKIITLAAEIAETTDKNVPMLLLKLDGWYSLIFIFFLLSLFEFHVIFLMLILPNCFPVLQSLVSLLRLQSQVAKAYFSYKASGCSIIFHIHLQFSYKQYLLLMRLQYLLILIDYLLSPCSEMDFFGKSIHMAIGLEHDWREFLCLDCWWLLISILLHAIIFQKSFTVLNQKLQRPRKSKQT